MKAKVSNDKASSLLRDHRHARNEYHTAARPSPSSSLTVGVPASNTSPIAASDDMSLSSTITADNAWPLSHKKKKQPLHHPYPPSQPHPYSPYQSHFSCCSDDNENSDSNHNDTTKLLIATKVAAPSAKKEDDGTATSRGLEQPIDPSSYESIQLHNDSLSLLRHPPRQACPHCCCPSASASSSLDHSAISSLSSSLSFNTGSITTLSSSSFCSGSGSGSITETTRAVSFEETANGSLVLATSNSNSHSGEVSFEETANGSLVFSSSSSNLNTESLLGETLTAPTEDEEEEEKEKEMEEEKESETQPKPIKSCLKNQGKTKRKNLRVQSPPKHVQFGTGCDHDYFEQHYQYEYDVSNRWYTTEEYKRFKYNVIKTVKSVLKAQERRARDETREPFSYSAILEQLYDTCFAMELEQVLQLKVNCTLRRGKTNRSSNESSTAGLGTNDDDDEEDRGAGGILTPDEWKQVRRLYRSSLDTECCLGTERLLVQKIGKDRSELRQSLITTLQDLQDHFFLGVSPPQSPSSSSSQQTSASRTSQSPSLFPPAPPLSLEKGNDCETNNTIKIKEEDPQDEDVPSTRDSTRPHAQYPQVLRRPVLIRDEDGDPSLSYHDDEDEDENGALFVSPHITAAGGYHITNNSSSSSSNNNPQLQQLLADNMCQISQEVSRPSRLFARYLAVTLQQTLTSYYYPSTTTTSCASSSSSLRSSKSVLSSSSSVSSSGSSTASSTYYLSSSKPLLTIPTRRSHQPQGAGCEPQRPEQQSQQAREDQDDESWQQQQKQKQQASSSRPPRLPGSRRQPQYLTLNHTSPPPQQQPQPEEEAQQQPEQIRVDNLVVNGGTCNNHRRNSH